MSSLLRQPVIVTAPRRLGAGVDEWVDPDTQALIDEMAEASYRRGLIDGQVNAQTALIDERERATTAIAIALKQALEEVGLSLTAATHQMTTLAFDLAEIIAGHQMQHDSSVIAERVATALDQMDDERINLSVATVDEPMFAAAYSTNPTINIIADPHLSPGEAMLRGRWSEADLTRSGIRTALEEALNA